MRWSSLSLSAVFLVALAACTPAVSMAPPTRHAAPGDYPAIYDRWTRVGRALSKVEFDTNLIVSATLRGPEFQDAYSARYLALYNLSGDEATAFRAAEEARPQSDYHFAVQVQGHSYGWADLTATKSLWRVSLSDDSGKVLVPSNIELVRNRQQVEQALFEHPLRGPYVRSFHLTFPRVGADGQPLFPGDPRRLTLTFAGPGGRVDLHWTLR